MENRPQIDLLVLDAIQDDPEQITSILRMLAEWRSTIDEEYTVDDVVPALKRLVVDGLVRPLEESTEEPCLQSVQGQWPRESDAHINDYWYEPTARGRAVWDTWAESTSPE